MMDLTKHIEFFNPAGLRTEDVNIIGVGAVGSWIAIQLAKLGLRKVTIWDFDTVDDHNITNQVYTQEDIGKLKTDALKAHLLANNPEMEVVCHGKYEGQDLSGIIFMEVDSVELRHKIALESRYNGRIDMVIDGRIGLATGIVYAVDWKKDSEIENYISLCDFKDSESDAPVSACGTTLSVSPTVLIVAAEAVADLINHVNGKPVAKRVAFDSFESKLASFF
jgi:molybdopterin/thiamine biosynthesis adenylyltransferase